MKHFRIATMAAMAAAAFANAQESPKIDTSIDIDLNSKYVWRGVNFVNDWVLQPSLTASTSGFTFTFWGNMELTNWNSPNYPKNPKMKFTEFDTALDYTGDWSGGTWSLGYIDYQFPGTGAARFGEWYGALSSSNYWGNPKLTVFRGANANMGTYASLGVTHTVACPMGGKCKCSSWDIGATVGFGDKKANNFFYGGNVSGLSDLLISASTSMEIGKGWTFDPSLTFSTLLNRNLSAGLPRRTNVWAGFSFTRKF